MAENKSNDDKLIKEVKNLLEGHKTHYEKYDTHLSKSFAKYVGDGTKTVKDLIKPLSEEMNGLLETYLGIVGIKGDLAKEYLRGLTLTAQDIRDMFSGRESKKYDLETAAQIKNALKQKLEEKLQEIIITKARNLENVGKLKDLAGFLHKEAGSEHLVPDYKAAIVDHTTGARHVQMALGQYMQKMGQEAGYKKKPKYEK